MFSKNKFKYQMYYFLNSYNKNHDINKTKNKMIDKFKIDEEKFWYVVYQCVEFKYIDGIKCSKSINNHIHTILLKHIYITYLGYEFIKTYYEFIKKIFWNLFLIITTAVVTVIINNKFSNSNQRVNSINDIFPQNIKSVKVGNNSNN